MKYRAILMDPPWSFKTFSGKHVTPHRCAEDHYKTMERHQIAGLPIPDLADKHCALFMWVVDSHLDESLDLMRIWGFRFKTIAFVWKKETVNGKPMIGMGYWTRKQTEVCLLATRGSPGRESKGVRQLIEAPRREHSRKPDEIYDRIEALVGGPYLEMFARQRRDGWASWGNEIDKFPVMATLADEERAAIAAAGPGPQQLLPPPLDGLGDFSRLPVQVDIIDSLQGISQQA